MSRVIAAFTQFFDGNGDPLVNGWLRFLQSSTNNTLKNTYADANLSLPNENPLQLDAEGRCPNVFGQGSYRVDLFYNNTVTNAPGELVQSFDPVSTFDTPAGTGGNFAEWVDTTVYQVSNIVVYNGFYYRSITADNLGNPPDTNTDQWEQIAFLRYYNPDVVYNEDDLVISDGALYFSLVDLNQGNTPLTSPAYWGAVGAGTVLFNWEEFGTVLRPVVSGYNIGDPTHYVGEMYLTAFADFPVTPSMDPTADYHITNKLYVDTEVSTRVRHWFEWTPGQTYYLNDQVRDDNWTMIANTTTEERPAPQAVGDIVWVRDSFSPPAFSETNQSEPALYVVQRYEFTPAFTVRRCRIFIPTSGIGLNCEVWAVYSPLTNSRIIQLVPPFEVSEDEAGDWKYIDVNNVYVESGSLVDVVMVLREPTGASSFAYEWEYTVATGDPASGQMAHQRGANIDKLRIHEEDSGAVDRSAFLDLLHPGSTIYKPDDGYTWEVLSISKTGQIYYLTVDPGAHGSESTQTFTFTYFASSAISYVYNTDLYISDSRITGFVTNEYDPVGATPTDDGYGIDILVQNMIASTDWDVVSQPPLGGESPGGGTTLLYWEEVGNIFRPITSGAGQLGDATHLIDDAYFGDGARLYLGDNQDLVIYHTGSAAFILNSIGSLSIGTTAAEDLVLASNGTGRWTIDGVGDITPNLTGAYSIGSTGLRVLKLWADDIESTNVPTIAGGSFIDAAVPDQTSHSEEFLTTDGSSVSWSPITVLTEQENALYNPLMSVWQRGAGTVSTTASYSADNVKLYFSGTAAYIDQTTGTTINGYTYTEYGVAITHTAGSATTNYCLFVSFVENVCRIQNTTATINIVANIPSGNSCAVSCIQHSGTTVLNEVAASELLVGTGAVEVYTVTVSLPDISGETLTIEDSYLSIEFWTDAGSSYGRANSLGHQTSGTSYVYAMQIRPGVRDSIIEIPTPESIISQCYRYYFLMGGQGAAYTRFAVGYWTAATTGFAATFLPVPLRKIPTSWTQSGPFFLTNGAGGAVATGISIDSGGTTTQVVDWSVGSASGGTAGNQLTLVASTDGNTSLGVTAEY